MSQVTVTTRAGKATALLSDYLQCYKDVHKVCGGPLGGGGGNYAISTIGGGQFRNFANGCMIVQIDP